MGFDIKVHLLIGFKLQLNIAFESKLIKPEIVDGDEYQMIGEPECRDEIIEDYIISNRLKEFLKNKQWNIYILTSSQEDSDPEKSYFYIYNYQQVIQSGAAPDYKTGELDEFCCQGEYESAVQFLGEEVQLSGDYDWDYQNHWIVESSY